MEVIVVVGGGGDSVGDGGDSVGGGQSIEPVDPTTSTGQISEAPRTLGC